jgi:Zn ribbon nucleic-acid-binding protein
MDRVGDLNPAQLAALPKDWYQPTREAFNDLNSAPGWCAHNLKELKIEIISSSKRFVAASSAQHCDCTYQMPPGMKTVELRENVFCGDAHTEHDEATQARVGAELVAVEGEGGEQRLQLQLYGSMPGMLANPKRAFDVNALRTLQQLVNVKLASLLLWLFRGEGILTAANAWGMLRHVRPITGDTAAAASQDESSCYGCSI